MNMLTILNVTAPIFLLILVGFVIVKSGIMPREALPGMSRYVLFLALPLLVFQKISQMDIRRIVDADYMLVYGIGCLAAFALVYGVSRYLQQDSVSFAGLKSLGGSFPNSAFIGFPILLQYFDSPPTQAFVMTMLVENILLFPVAFALMETTEDRSADMKQLVVTVTARVLKNPIIIAVCAGVAASLTGLTPPQFVDHGMSLLASSAAPVALVIIGGSLAGVTFSVKLRDVLLISGVKLVFQPLLMLLLVLFLVPDLDPVLKQAAVIFAAAPMMSMFPIIGGQYGHQSWCSGVLLMTTVMAFFSVTLMMSLLQFLG